MIRGGSWNSNARNCRSSNRNNNDPSNDNNNLGFRLVLPQPNRVIRRSTEKINTDGPDTVLPVCEVMYMAKMM